MAMNAANPLFLIPVLTGPAFMFMGTLLLKHPPKKINGFYGYRTSKSMRSQERWDFAQIFSAMEMIKGGGLLAFTSIIGLFYNPNEVAGTIFGCSLVVAALVMLVINTERAITKKFDKT